MKEAKCSNAQIEVAYDHLSTRKGTGISNSNQYFLTLVLK